MKCIGKKWALSAISATCAAVALMTATSVFAANEYASVSANSSGINVQTHSGHVLTVTVSGPDGLIMQQTLAAGEGGNLGEGHNLPDGYYNYEINAVPESPAGKASSEVNASDGETDENGRSAWAASARSSGLAVQTGGFRISGGSLVNSSITE